MKKLNTTYDGRHKVATEELDLRTYDEKPKVRGVFTSFIIAFFTWMISSNMLALVIFTIYEVFMYFGTGNAKPNIPWGQCYATILMFAMFMDFFAHFTAIICYYQCRTEPSLKQSVLFSLFGRRVWF